MKTSSWYSLGIGIGSLFLAVVFLIIAIATDPFARNERFTELFIEESTIATTTDSSVEVQLSSGIINQENSPTIYNYEIALDSPSTSEKILTTGSELISDGEQYIMSHSLSLPINEEGHQITVRLPDFDLEVHTTISK